MLDWGTIRPAVEQYVHVALQGELPTLWRRESAAELGTDLGQGFVELDVGELTRVGADDEVITSLNEAGTALTTKVCGVREFPLYFKVWSPEQAPARRAHQYAERLDMLLWHPGFRDALKSAGLVFMRNEKVVTLDQQVNGRLWSVAVSTAVFNAQSVEELPSPAGDLDFIEHAGVVLTVNEGAPDEVVCPEDVIPPLP